MNFFISHNESREITIFHFIAELTSNAQSEVDIQKQSSSLNTHPHTHRGRR